ncbi:MAG: glycosyltransferase family 4 protein [Balneola sp.]
MNILQIRGDFIDNGPGTQMLTISEALRKRGHQVEVAASGGLLKEKIIKSGFVFHTIEDLARTKRAPWNILSAIAKLRKLFNEREIDVVHAHNAATLYLSFLASITINRKVKLFHSCRGIELRKNYQWRNWIYLKYPGHIFAVSEFTKNMLVNIGVKPDGISVTYNGVDLSRFDIEKKEIFRKKIRSEFNIPDDAIVIGIIGKMGTKGHDEIIKAFANLEKEFTNVYALLVGGGPFLEEFKLLASNLNVSDRLKFVGIRFEAEMFNSAFDIFALPSYWGEMFPNALLEAMAMKNPIISTKLSGIPEIFTKDIGYLIERKDTQALEEKLRFLIANKEERLKMGNTARELLMERFTIQNVVDIIEMQYLNKLED